MGLACGIKMVHLKMNLTYNMYDNLFFKEIKVFLFMVKRCVFL